MSALQKPESIPMWQRHVKFLSLFLMLAASEILGWLLLFTALALLL